MVLSYTYILIKTIFFNDTATTEIYTLSLHDALPISPMSHRPGAPVRRLARVAVRCAALTLGRTAATKRHLLRLRFGEWAPRWLGGPAIVGWRGVRIEVDPGEAHGFHVFAHGDYGGAELDARIQPCPEGRVCVGAGGG